MAAPKINYVKAAALLSAGLSYTDIAGQLGPDIDPDSLRRGLQRKGLSLKRVNNTAIGQSSVSGVVSAALSAGDTVTLKAVRRVAGAKVREGLGRVLEAHTEALERVETRSEPEHIAKVGAAMEPLARTAKIVYGWSEGDGEGVVMVGRMTPAEEETNQVIDLPTEPKQLPQMDI